MAGKRKKSIGRPEPIREDKVDRNAPCPCGSGRKYKKCCAEDDGPWWLDWLFLFGFPRWRRKKDR